MTAYVLRFILYLALILYVAVSRREENEISKRIFNASIVAVVSLLIQWGVDYATLLFVHPTDPKTYIPWAIVLDILEVMIPLVTVYIIAKSLRCLGVVRPAILIVCTIIVCLISAAFAYEQVQMFFVSMEKLKHGNFMDAFIAGQDLAKLGKVMLVVRLIPAAVLGFLKAKEE